MEHSKLTVVVFLDLTKAFDTVDHSIQQNKLTNFNIDATAIDWFKDYLKDW